MTQPTQPTQQPGPRLPITPQLAAQMNQLGFQNSGLVVKDYQDHPSVCLVVEGDTKAGKNIFAFRDTPRGVAIFSSDAGTVPAMESCGLNESNSVYFYFEMPDTSAAVVRHGTPEQDTIAKAAKLRARQEATTLWPKVKAAMGFVLDNYRALGVRTVVLDTANSLWDLCQIYHQGKLIEIPKEVYPVMNADFKGQVMQFSQVRGLTTLLLSRVKPEYKDQKVQVNGETKTISVKTGKQVRQGWAQLDYESDATVRCELDPITGIYRSVIVGSRHRATEVRGMVFETSLTYKDEWDETVVTKDTNSFINVAEALRPKTKGMWR